MEIVVHVQLQITFGTSFQLSLLQWQVVQYFTFATEKGREAHLVTHLLLQITKFQICPTLE